MTDTAAPTIHATGKLAILGLGILPTLGLSTIAVMLPAIADAFGRDANDIEIKMVSTAVGLGMFLGAPLGGLLLDRLGRRSALMIAAALFGILGCSIMLMNSLWGMIFARFLIGLAAGAIGVGTAAVIGDHFSGSAQSRWIGYAGAMSSGSTIIFSPITGFLTDYSWRIGFALYAIALPIFLAIMIGIPKAAADKPVADSKSFMLPLNKIPFNALLLAGILGTLAVGTSLYWPFRLRELGVLSASALAFHALPQIICITLMAFLYGVVRRYLSVENIFIVASILSGVGLAIIAFAPNGLLMMVGLGIEGLGIGMMTPNLTTYALAISPLEYRGRVLGLVKGAVYGSPFVTQFILLPLSHIGGNAMALLGICVISMMLAFAVFRGWIGRTDRRVAA